MTATDAPWNERLKTARLAAGLSQTEAARRAGLSQSTWYNYEKAVCPPSEETWAHLMAVVGDALGAAPPPKQRCNQSSASKDRGALIAPPETPARPPQSYHGHSGGPSFRIAGAAIDNGPAKAPHPSAGASLREARLPASPQGEAAGPDTGNLRRLRGRYTVTLVKSVATKERQPWPVGERRFGLGEAG